MPKFNATSSSDSSLPWSLYGSLPCSKLTVLPSGRKVTSTVFSPGASTVVVPVPCAFSSDIRPLGCKLVYYFYSPLFKIRLRHRMAGVRPFLEIGVVHGLSLEGGRDSRIHHQFRQTHRGLIQRVDGSADRVIVVVIAILYRNQIFLQRLDVASFVVRDLLPGMILFAFRERRQDRVGFAARFDDLPLPEIFFGVVVGFEQHVL